ncbi:MAG: rRNA synthase [Patescibacteria group bacterium]|nr:rRNA synthase [Patescibacteria group bacterium]
MFKYCVILEDGITSPAIVKIVEENNTSTVLQVTLFEGKNRQIRRMCEKLELDLLELSRVAFGEIKIDNLKDGEYRKLSQDEVQLLEKAVER